MNSTFAPKRATLPVATATLSGLSTGGCEGLDDARLGDAIAWHVCAVLPEGFDVALLDNAAPEVRVEALPCRSVTALASRVRRSLFDQAAPANRAGDPDWMARRLGLTLPRSREAVVSLCNRPGVAADNLNLDLGPLGRLL